MSHHERHAGHADAADPIERLVNYIPIVLPVAGGALIFLLAFIAVFLA